MTAYQASKQIHLHRACRKLKQNAKASLKLKALLGEIDQDYQKRLVQKCLMGLKRYLSMPEVVKARHAK